MQREKKEEEEKKQEQRYKNSTNLHFLLMTLSRYFKITTGDLLSRTDSSTATFISGDKQKNQIVVIKLRGHGKCNFTMFADYYLRPRSLWSCQAIVPSSGSDVSVMKEIQCEGRDGLRLSRKSKVVSFKLQVVSLKW